MRQSIVARCHLFSLSIKISLLPMSFKYSNDWRTILFSAAHTIPFKRHGCRTPSATTLFLSIEIYYVHQFLLDIANVSFLVNKFKKIITLLKCLETRRKETYSSFYFLSFFFFLCISHTQHIHTNIHTCTYTREDTTLELHSDLTRFTSSIATPNDSRYKWKIPLPLPSPPLSFLIRSFRFLIVFIFLSLFFSFFSWLTGE